MKSIGTLKLPQPLLGRLERECEQTGSPTLTLVRLLVDEALSVREARRSQSAKDRSSVEAVG